MRKTWMLVAVVLSGCGGTEPELYDLVVNFFTIPDSCQQNGMAPSSGTTTAPPRLIQVQVWDGPENSTFLEVQGTGISVDMGAAPNVNIGGIFTGKRGDKGWVFTSEASARQTVAGNTVVDTAKAELVFERVPQFKGTASLNSSRTCTGAQCPTTSPSCAVSGITFSGTRLAVEYQRAP